MEHLDDLDPFECMDREAARIDAHLAALPDDAWAAATRCEGWDVHDLVAHLAGSEEYNHACLDDAIGPLFERYTGVTDVHSFNAAGVADRRDRSHADVLDEWRSANARTRRELRQRRDGDLPTMVGPYPVRWQAVHLAAELATHADDLGVPEQPDEAAERRRWRARAARAMLAEARPETTVDELDERWRLRLGERVVDLDDAELIAVVNGRAPGADAELRAALDLMP